MRLKFSSVSALALCLATALGADTPKDVTTYGFDVVFARNPDVTLSEFQEKGLRKFREMDAYFGALFVSEDGNAYQHFVNWHDLTLVKQAARKGCEMISRGSPCYLSTVSVPAGYDPNGPTEPGLGLWALRDWQNEYLPKQESGSFGAFAVSNSAHQGYSHGWFSAEEAREAAIAYCKAAVAQDLAGLGIEGRAYALARGFDRCTIIDERRTP
ncbi:hypothetical protein [Sulfitobacter sp. S190]|uniref:hypothetical protein n=1 Tax=Sulfitobacter sp. S190 TaxID=2867022 RepID=UPI0021A6A7EB|nr:hypothetical protein [Sulfitobacter sp. S190]UWR23599.1 hypothetical protein K3756_06420 [Sulfitobacter sp. S190]